MTFFHRPFEVLRVSSATESRLLTWAETRLSWQFYFTFKEKKCFNVELNEFVSELKPKCLFLNICGSRKQTPQTFHRLVPLFTLAPRFRDYVVLCFYKNQNAKEVFCFHLKVSLKYNFECEAGGSGPAPFSNINQSHLRTTSHSLSGGWMNVINLESR